MNDEARSWVDEGFRQLAKVLGRNRMLQAKTVLPTDEFFPDRYHGTEQCAQSMFRRVCTYMRVDPQSVKLHIYPDESADLKKIMPYWHGSGHDSSGVYFHEQENGSRVLGLKASNLQDPLKAVATLAHELAHVVLLGGELIDPDSPDMEPLTDLATVYLGLGVFNANSAAQFKKFQDERKQGWSMERLGYLPEPVFGYALGRYAFERGELKPAWKSFLTTNLQSDVSRSIAWLVKESA